MKHSQLLLLVLANLLVLDFFIFHSVTTNQTVLGESTTAAVASACPKSCLSAINSMKTKTSTDTTPKESYISLGSGTGSSGDWADVTGLAAYIDSLSYKKGSRVTFEVNVAVPTGNQTVWIRLVNATDGRAISGSELSMEGSGPSALISGPINLDYGKKLYKVQMKTQLQYPANIHEARVHITTN